jgi:hypothetical protein
MWARLSNREPLILVDRAPEGKALRSDSFRDAALSEGWKATALAARPVPRSSYNLLTSTDELREIQGRFMEFKAREGR